MRLVTKNEAAEILDRALDHWHMMHSIALGGSREVDEKFCELFSWANTFTEEFKLRDTELEFEYTSTVHLYGAFNIFFVGRFWVNNILSDVDSVTELRDKLKAS